MIFFCLLSLTLVRCMKTSQLNQQSRMIITTADLSSLKTTHRISTPPSRRYLLDKKKCLLVFCKSCSPDSFNNGKIFTIIEETGKNVSTPPFLVQGKSLRNTLITFTPDLWPLKQLELRDLLGVLMREGRGVLS